MVTFQMLKTRKLEKAKIFQLCTVIFPTMIMEVQIMKIFPLYAQSVKVSAFHLQRFGNGEIWYERSEKNVKVWIFSNFVQSFFQLWLLKCKYLMYIIIPNNPAMTTDVKQDHDYDKGTYMTRPSPWLSNVSPAGWERLKKIPNQAKMVVSY